MLKVTLIGDSVCMAYQPLVADRLRGQAEVWGPEGNGGTSRNVLSHLNAWALSRRADVLHLNCGLHDLAIEPDGANRIALDEYESNLRAIAGRIAEGFAGRVIWGTTTPVIDEWHRRNKSFERHQADVVRYNEAALSVVREQGGEVNDLHEVIVRARPELCLSADGVHMNDRGNQLLAEAVAAAVMSEWR